MDDVILHTRVKHMNRHWSNIDLSAAEIQLVSEVGREQALGRSLYPVDRYDYVLIRLPAVVGLADGRQ